MERMTKAERAQALEVFLGEAPGMDAIMGKRWLHITEGQAIELHRLYVEECNRSLRSYEVERLETLEASLKARFKAAGLGLYLNGDPRGNPVGILTPKTGRYNTMGGRECGWRL